MSEPLVSVRVITYNHEKYIAQCLEGILMQRTNFPFEVIVGEDCSTDRTREIVLDYQTRFPDKIRVITSETNVGGMANVIRVQQACRGKYHALCEGDDYWIDPLKLQKQADFMEAHPDFSMCFHDAFIARTDKSAAPRYYFSNSIPDTIDMDVFLQLNLTVPTASIVIRAEIYDTLPVWRQDLVYSDLLLRLWCVYSGKIKYLPDVMSVYRIHTSSLTAGNARRLEAHYAHIVEIYQKFNNETNQRYARQIQAVIQKVEEEAQARIMRQKLGRFYFFLYPGMALRRAQEIMDVIRNYNRMYTG